MVTSPCTMFLTVTRWTGALPNSAFFSHWSGSSSQRPNSGSQNLQIFPLSCTETADRDGRTKLTCFWNGRANDKWMQQSRVDWCTVYTASHSKWLLLQCRLDCLSSRFTHRLHLSSWLFCINICKGFPFPFRQPAAAVSLQLTGALEERVSCHHFRFHGGNSQSAETLLPPLPQFQDLPHRHSYYTEVI